MEQLSFSGICTDGAVFPRNAAFRITGFAGANAEVTVQFDELTLNGKADEQGRFAVEVPPRQAETSCSVKVTSGGKSIELANAAVGEIYLCAGQSNMEFRLKGQIPEPVPEDFSGVQVRICRIPANSFRKGVDDVHAEWITDPGNREKWEKITAVGYYFARALSAARNIVVGIVDVSIGGTNIAAWLPPEELAKIPFTAARAAEYDKTPQPEIPKKADAAGLLDPHYGGGTPDGMKILNNLFARTISELKPAKPWQDPALDDSAWALHKMPSEWLFYGDDRTGVYWYRKRFTLPREWQGRDLMLSLGGIDQQDVTYVNGVEVGRTASGFDFSQWNSCRRYRVPNGILHPGENLIAVRVVGFFQLLFTGGMVGPDDKMFISPVHMANENEKIPLAGLWRAALEQRYEREFRAEMFQSGGEGIQHAFHILWDNMIRPLHDAAFSGVVWYQGEADAVSAEMADCYLEELRALRRSWRKFFNQPALPFYFVQLPGFMVPEEYQEHCYWTNIRDAQLRAALDEGGYPAVLSDAGEEWEIHCRDKRSAGERLARLVLFPKFPQRAHGPALAEVSCAGNRMRCRFTAVGGGLAIRHGDSLMHGWAVAGADKVFHTAAAAIVARDTVEVMSSLVDAPKYVAYGWSLNPQNANLVNSEDLPASPFRTLERYPGEAEPEKPEQK